MWLLLWDKYPECVFDDVAKAIEYVEALYRENSQRQTRKFYTPKLVTFEVMDGGIWVKSDARIKLIPKY